MKLVPILLLSVATLGAAVLGASFVYPGGFSALQEDLLGDAPNFGGSRDPGPTEKPAKANGGPVDAKSELTMAHAAYDSGDFNSAVTQYVLARGYAADETQRRRAVDGLERAVLAYALVNGSPAIHAPGAPTEFARLKAEAESKPSEQAWLAAARYGAGAGIRSGLSYAVERCLESAVAGGPVETQLRRSLVDRKRRDSLRAALKARGLDDSLPAATSIAHVGTDPEYNPDTEGDDDPSGIGGVGSTKVERPPMGRFDDAMRKRLSTAMRSLAEARDEHRLASPGMPDRTQHRKRAIALLLEVRTVLSNAMDTDPKALGLDRRLREVHLLLSELRKDSHIDD